MAEPFRAVELENGLKVCFYDISNRYYGDFHRVCIEVKIDIPSQSILLSDEQARLAEKLENPLCFETRLERMGVAGGELRRVREALVDSFLTSSSSYFNKPGFASQLLKKKLSEKARPIFFRD